MWVTVSGILIFVLCLAVVVFSSVPPSVCIGISTVLYAVSAVLILLRLGAVSGKSFTAGGNVPDSILRDSVMNMNFPMLICDMNTGKVIWYNKASATLTGNSSLFGVTLESLLGITHEALLGEDGVSLEGEAKCGDAYYRVSGKMKNSGDKNFAVLTLEDITELKNAYDEAARKDTAVMYIIADNLAELAEYGKENYRGASAEISSILTAWAEGCGGVIKEYDRDRYICLVQAEKLEENIRGKFELLDRIRDLRVGDSAVPVTVSAGVSGVEGSLLEKDKAARAALEMALQRGGDQVVVKSEGSMEFYGGRTRTVQKRTRVKARVFAHELLMQMSGASSVLVMGHRFADFDCFGAAVGIARLAMFCGVPVHIVTDLSDGGMDACREIMAKEKSYRGVFVDKAQALDMVESDVLLVIVDVNNMGLVESPELADRCMNMVVIDHHRKTAEFEREPIMTYIEPSASATCELVSEMLEQCLPGGTLGVSEANMLLAGITLDTKKFTRNTGTRTFSAALYLRDAGADPTDVEELFKTSLEDFTREAKFRKDVVIYKGMFAVALGDGEGESSDRIAAAKAADKLLTVEGVKASFALIKIGDAVHISARSAGKVNVQLILEKLRGGGHFDSAGAQVEAGSVTDALTMLKAAIDSYIENS